MARQKVNLKRINEAVERIERMPINDFSRPGKTPVNTPLGFWAEITGKSVKKYSWRFWKGKDDNTHEADSSLDNGTTTERWAVHVRGCEVIPNGAIVWLTPSISQDYYQFDFNGQYIGIATTSITARSGSTWGSGSVSLYKRSATATYAALSPTQTVTAYNTGTAITSGKYVRLWLDSGSFGTFPPVWLAEPLEC